jgi:hypothetical protein
MCTSESGERRKKTTYEFALRLIEDLQLLDNLVVLADVAPDLWKQKEETAAPELCIQRNCTALPSCATNLKTEGAHDSAPLPQLLYKSEKKRCATMHQRESKERVKQLTSAREKRKSSGINPRPLFTRKRGELGDHRDHNCLSLPGSSQARNSVRAPRKNKIQFHFHFT